MVSEYKFCCHNKRWVVFSPDWHLDTALSSYAQEQAQYAKNTFDSYTRQVRKWLNFLIRRKIVGSLGAIWNLEPRRLRSLVYSYLTEETECKVPRTRFNENARLVVEQPSSSGSPRQFMAALISFYRIMRDLGFYRYRSPLEWSASERKDRKENLPKKRMPQISGCEEPYKKEYRLSNNYYVFKFNEWKPRSIDCKKFPRLVKAAGITVGWSAREEVIFDILAESGCRVSEVMALTLKDWIDLGLGNGARAISKGSAGVRTKSLSWSPRLTEALKKYFDRERKKFDPFNWELTDYLRRADDHLLSNTPLFLSRHGTQLRANTFRLKYWNPAIKHAGIRANIHQIRHWYVTRSMQEMFEKHNTFDIDNPNVTKELNDFIYYMKWKSPATVDSYNHLFNTNRLAPIQNKIYKVLEDNVYDDTKVPMPEFKTKNTELQSREKNLKLLLNMVKK